MKNITFSVEQAMTVHVPMCVVCGNREVQIVVNSTGAGYCTAECESSYSTVSAWFKSTGAGYCTAECESSYSEEPPYGHDLDGYEYPEFDG